MKNLKNKILIAVVGVLSFIGLPASAVEIKNPDSGFFVDNLGGQSTFRGILLFAITKILLPLTGMIAVFFIILGGYQYITSGANEELAESGKKTLQNAIIGLVIVILAYVIVTVVINTVTKGVE